MADQIKTVKVWINAFIPRDLPDLTFPAPGASAGKTMVKGPLGTCFLGDQRTYDDYIHASSRLHSELSVDVATVKPLLEWHNCDPTHQIDATTGVVKAKAQASTKNMRFLRLRGSSSRFEFDVEAAARNPLLPSPDVDFTGTITVDVAARTIRFNGKVDQCPAFEMYASVNNTKALPVFKTKPLPGKTMWNLPGAANRAVNEIIPIPDRLP